MFGLSNPFKKKKKKLDEDTIPEEDRGYEYDAPEPRFEDFDREDEDYPGGGEGSSDEFDGGGSAGNPFSGMEQRIDTEPVVEQAKSGRRLKGGLIAGIVAVIAMCTVGVMAYNFIKPKTVPQINRGGKEETATADVRNTQGSTLPQSYSDLARYEQEQKQKDREYLIKTGQLNPAKEQREKAEAKQKERREKEAKERAEKAARERQRVPDVTPPSRPSLPNGANGVNGSGRGSGRENDKYSQYNTPVGFQVTESGKVAQSGVTSVFQALPGTGQATGKKYVLHTGTIIPVTLLTGMTSDSKSAGVTAQVRQDVYDSLTGTHLLIPQGSKIVGTGGGTSGRRMEAMFTRIILPNGASIKLSGPRATDSMGYSGLRDKYDEKWGPAVKGAFLAGLFTGIADWVGDIDTKTTSDGTLVRSAWGSVAEKVSDKIGEKAERLDQNESPAVIIRPGFQFNVYLTEDIDIYQYQPLKEEPR